MKCGCIKRLETEMKEAFTKDQRFLKPIKSVSIESALMFGEQLTQKTYSNVDIELEGQKKIITQKITHSFCPFCGTEIKDEKKEPKVA